MKTKILISIIILSFYLIPNVFASVGTASTPVLVRDNTGSSAEMYEAPIQSDRFFQYGDYIFTFVLYGNTYNIKRAYASDDDGSTWDDASGIIAGCDYNHKPFGSNFLDVVYDEVNNIAHVSDVQIASSSFPYYIYYLAGVPSALGTWIEDGSASIKLHQQNQYQMSSAICLLDETPVISAWFYNGTSSYAKVWFTDEQLPTVIGDFTSYTLNIGLEFGSTFGIIYNHPISSSEIILIFQRTADARIFGVICDKVTGFGSIFEMIEDDVGAYNDGNGWFAPTIHTYSEYTENHTNYAENIAIAWINTSNYLKFAFWNISSATLSTPENLYDDSGNYDAGLLTIGKDKDTYFVGFNGNRTDYTHTDFLVFERNPNTETWNYTNVYQIDELSQYSPDGVSMSQKTFNGKFYGTFIDNTIDAYIFNFDIEGEFIPEPTETEEFEPYFVDANGWFILVGILVLLGIFIFSLNIKQKSKYR